MDSNFKIAVEAIFNVKKIFVTAHDKPDGDALGAAEGMVKILKGSGLDSEIVGCCPVPEELMFLADKEDFFSKEINNAESSNRFISSVREAVNDSIMIVLDCGSPERAEVVPAWIEAGGKIINIDHHASNNNFGNINIVDENASSTSELICLLCKYSENFKITPSAADALYTGLITDTGRFTYENTTRVSLECAAELLNCGAVPSKLGDKLYRSVSKKCVRLSARAASSLQFRYSGKVAWVSLSRKDFAHFDATPADAGDIIDIARNISGVEIAFFFYEIPDTNETKISIRSSAPFDATEIATHYNGGGHKRAAGCSMEKPLDETIENVLDFIEEHWTLDN